MQPIVCTAWQIDEKTGEAIRDFEVQSGLFAAEVTLVEQITGDPPDDPERPWQWSATRHDDDDQDDRRASDEEHEWIRAGLASTREEGMALADDILRAEGYVAK